MTGSSIKKLKHLNEQRAEIRTVHEFFFSEIVESSFEVLKHSEKSLQNRKLRLTKEDEVQSTYQTVASCISHYLWGPDRDFGFFDENRFYKDLETMAKS